MERSSSQTRMLATQPPFCPGGCELRRRSGGQARCGEGFRRASGGGPFCVEPFCVQSPQPKNESGAMSWLGTGPDFAFMRLHDLVDDCQAEAGATFETRLEGLENLFGLLRGHSGSGVGEADLPIVSQVFDADLQGAAVAH